MIRPTRVAARIFGVLLLIGGAAGGRSCTRRECETTSLPAHCKGKRLTYCSEE